MHNITKVAVIQIALLLTELDALQVFENKKYKKYIYKQKYNALCLCN